MRLSYRQLLGISLVSMSALTLEIVLTRIFSVTMRYHFAFLAISLALLGSATAGVVLYFFPQLTQPQRAQRWIGLVALALALSVPLTFVLYLQIPFRLSLDRSQIPLDQLAYLALIYLDMTVPFFLSGMILSLALAAWAEQAGRVYWADLTGAALGCLFSILALEALGGPTAVLAAGALAALACLILSWGTVKRFAAALLLALALIGLMGANAIGGWIRIPISRTGVNPREYTLVYERWNAHSQVTVYEVSRYPFFWSADGRQWERIVQEGRFLNHAMLLIDTVAGTPIQEFRGLLSEEEFLRYDLTSLVYHLIDQPQTLVIGAGGGRDVLAALASDAPHVTAVEINPAVIDVVRGPYADFAGHLYERPDVTVVIDDARGYITRSPERYDVIQASLIDTWAAGASGAFALSENSLYTVEAFQTYYDHLTDRGMLTISRWYLTERPAETMRLVSTGMEGWSRAGAADPRQHIAVVARPNARGQLEGMATALFKRTPFTAEEVERLVEKSEELGFTVLYAPGLPTHEEVGQFIAADDHAAVVAAYPVDISPATDNRPFFFNLVRFGDLLDLSLVASGVYRNSVEALLVLAAALAISALLGVLFIILPIGLGARRRGLPRPSWRLLAYFGLLGAAFMLAEVAVIQRLSVYLGRPVYSLAVVLFSLLLFSGLGSLWVGRRLERRPPSQWLRRFFPILVALLLLQALAAPWLLCQTIAWPLVARLGVTIALLAPLGFLLGMPFPAGMRWAGARQPGAVPWLWGINGVTSVMGSALALALAIHLGLLAALLAAAGAYGLAGLALALDTRKETT